MSNKYGERTQPYRTPSLTWNHSDSVPATLTLANCFLRWAINGGDSPPLIAHHTSNNNT